MLNYRGGNDVIMSEYYIRSMELDELKAFYERIERAMIFCEGRTRSSLCYLYGQP